MAGRINDERIVQEGPKREPTKIHFHVHNTIQLVFTSFLLILKPLVDHTEETLTPIRNSSYGFGLTNKSVVQRYVNMFTSCKIYF